MERETSRVDTDMCQICDMQERWGLSDSEADLFQNAIRFLMQTELDHLEKCEKDFECILGDARSHRKDNEYVGKCFLQAGEAYQAVQSAEAACDTKFKELLLVVSRPGHA